ncbi:heme NO-binding domain-containing protein [Teichococcus vastitatis]|uniref:Heme NO-binding domain-containing protein n=1 Tax=Teichococcus vastitatis TaxID=2307076 RepID=A0ABS9VZ09_9PROT|nr:heme NO-binding domain-containing protein [Pseudoroseomonas vastitatis]MCI0752221.1 heme NO-binding domain-containing protein [Pseudoroseomonas vastitatis]
MKGLVFTEFFRHVEARHGADMVDDVIEAADLPHDGGYTSVGSYPFPEMVALVVACSRLTGTPLPELLDAFGTHCFERWVHYAPQFFSRQRGLFDILEGINDFHETEVRKLYPDAELPSFMTEQRSGQRLVLGYHSCKPLSALAVGVIKGAAAHLGQRVAIACEPAEGDGGAYTRITIDLRDNPDAPHR